MRAGLLAAFSLVVPCIWAQTLAGEWDAIIRANGVDVPCRFLISGDGSNVQGTFFNDQELYRSTTGKFENDSLTLNFDYTTSKLDAVYKDGALDGTYHSTRGNYGFHAIPHVQPPAPSANPPDIAGAWEIALKSGKGEDAWQFLVRQNGPEIKASILRIDGDTGTLAGTWRDGKFTLSHFSGARPALLIVTPQADGSLHLVMNANTEYTALRPGTARAKGLSPPTDPSLHTGVKDPAQPFQFSFRDLNGKVISNADARFRNKVVVVNILGSWCPNCHDEAPFLEEMYKKYRAKGVEIVALDFEDAEQLQDPSRMRAFSKRYGIDYTVLVAGGTQEINQKLPQLRNFNAWPTTFFLGRDGRVAYVHAGFPSSASGQKYTEAKQEFEDTVERLLGVSSSIN
jgi:thiol-disulfide isomerase/thioredoxin